MNAPKEFTSVITLKIKATSPERLLGKKIMLARLAAGYTQDQLAKALGVNRATIADWEQGGVNFDLLYNLEEILGVEHGAFKVR